MAVTKMRFAMNLNSSGRAARAGRTARAEQCEQSYEREARGVPDTYADRTDDRGGSTRPSSDIRGWTVLAP